MTLSPNDPSFELGKAAIKGGSKSFRLASLFLNRQSQWGSYLLYRWCRYCDDQVDQAPSDAEAEAALEQLRLETTRALNGEACPTGSPFAALPLLRHQFQIPDNYFFDLLEGFRRDVVGEPILTLDDLLIYCYHVAGVVGLMMSHILQVKTSEALRPADQMGRAMQLTNICRDIGEDYKLQRLYIPRQWLTEFGITAATLLAPETESKLVNLRQKLLLLADELYAEGRKGLVYLPFRAAWSISVASFLYQGIGHEIQKRGALALHQRTILTPLQKLKSVAQGTFFFGKLLWQHWIQRRTERSTTL